MRNILLSVFLCFACWGELGAQSLARPDRPARESFYQLVYLHTIEIMEKTWAEWQKYPQNLSAESWYYAARIEYRRQDYVNAWRYWEKAGQTPGAPDWVKKSALAWQTLIGRGKVEKWGDISPRLLAEIAVVTRESGDPLASDYASFALNRARASGEILPCYWESVAITRPLDLALWQESLEAAFRRDDSPFVDPDLMKSLFACWEKAHTPEWFAYEADCAAPMLSLTPANVFKREEEIYIPEVRSALGGIYVSDGEFFWDRRRAVLWALAHLYGERGFAGDRLGRSARRYWHASSSLYDLLYLPSRRGSLRDFDMTGIIQMSRVWLALGRYEDMLAYIYTATPHPALKQIAPTLRPALQFLLAAQMAQRQPGNDDGMSVDPLELIWSPQVFFWEKNNVFSPVVSGRAEN